MKKAAKLDVRDLLDICAMKGMNGPQAAASGASSSSGGSPAGGEAAPPPAEAPVHETDDVPDADEVDDGNDDADEVEAPAADES